MSRIRTIKPEFWTSEQVMECKAVTRLLFIGMWNFADDKGRMTLSPKKIKAQVFPGDDDMTSENVRRMIAELSANGLVQLYSVNGVECVQITGWTKHQRIDKPQPSSIPGPETGSPLAETPVSETIPGMIAERSAREGKGEEGKGKEEDHLSEMLSDDAAIIEAEKKSKKPKADYPADFQAFWLAYPTDALMSKKEAFAVWKRLDPEDRALALRGVPALIEHQRKNQTYRMVHACRYLSQRRFEGLADSAQPAVEGVPQFQTEAEFDAWWANRRSAGAA